MGWINLATVEGEAMGFVEYLRRLVAIGKFSRPHRSVAVALRKRIVDLEQRLLETGRDRDEKQIALRSAEATVAELEQERHEQDVANRKLQGNLDVAITENAGKADLIVYYEQRIQTLTAIEAARAARATQPGGGAFDAQQLFGRD